MYRELGVEIKPTEKDDKVVVSDIYRESGIEIIDSASEENKTTEQKENPTVPMPSISMLKDKFENTTKSLNVVNNYSLPKINNTSNSVGTMPTVPTNTTPHDPYHEEI